MAIILNIDTALETASLCLAREAQVIASSMSVHQRDHASWFHPALQKLMTDAGVDMKGIDAIAITIGPGSYTGLRVGLAAAKGLCFVLQIPLIPVNTLEMLACASITQDADLICPLIDARRMEVFMALYDTSLVRLIEPQAMVIDPNSFNSLLLSNKILFCGNGNKKLKAMVNHPNAFFSDKTVFATDMVQLSEKYFREKIFADTAYVEPFYLKEFYSAAR
jgi:tRNA threonylcarbamoyladenosine biosynthesis protein TsaB